MAITYRVGDWPVIDQLAALRKSVGWDSARRDYPTAFDRYATMVAAYTSEDRLVGWAAVVSDGVRHGFLVDVIVHASHQRRGIGRELVGRAVADGRAKGLRLFHADFAASNEAFYKACGFTIGRGGYLDFQART